MRANNKKKRSLDYVAKVFNMPLILLELTNPTIVHTTRIHIPGYRLIKKPFASWKELAVYCKAKKISLAILELVNKQIDLNCIHIPVRVPNTLVTSLDHFTYEKLEEQIARLVHDYAFLEVNTIGKSHLNKNIYELKIGTGPYHTHFNAAFHGNEWITSALLMKCLELYVSKIVKNDDDVITYFETHTISIVPMVNPDGVNLVLNGASEAGIYEQEVLTINEENNDFSNWKANIRGIDLNKQYPALWKVEQDRQPGQPHFRDFPGRSPLTEAESIAMAELIKNNYFRRIHALHTQGEEIYWGFQGLETMESAKIAEKYAHVSNYKSVRYVNNYAGFKDWFIKSFHRPGFTIELGKGTNPLPFSQFDQMFKAVWSIFEANFTCTK